MQIVVIKPQQFQRGHATQPEQTFIVWEEDEDITKNSSSWSEMTVEGRGALMVVSDGQTEQIEGT